jgi:hypothetical protein
MGKLCNNHSILFFLLGGTLSTEEMPTPPGSSLPQAVVLVTGGTGLVGKAIEKVNLLNESISIEYLDNQ